jgi:hypothetical protein
LKGQHFQATIDDGAENIREFHVNVCRQKRKGNTQG